MQLWLDGWCFPIRIDNGMCSEVDYSYKGEKGDAYQTCTPVVTISSCVDVTPNNEVDLEKAVAIGPVSVAIEADKRNFQLYTSGVITGDACCTNLDHGVLAIDYRTEGSIPYWLVENSWGASWSDNSVKIDKSSSTNSHGACGLPINYLS